MHKSASKRILSRQRLLLLLLFNLLMVFLSFLLLFHLFPSNIIISVCDKIKKKFPVFSLETKQDFISIYTFLPFIIFVSKVVVSWHFYFVSCCVWQPIIDWEKSLCKNRSSNKTRFLFFWSVRLVWNLACYCLIQCSNRFTEKARKDRLTIGKQQ